MFHDLATYYYRNVLSSFLNCQELSRNGKYGDSQDLKSSLEAAMAMFHFREHLPDKIRPEVHQVEADCPDYALLGDIANAAKHRTLTRKTPHGPPLITSVDQLCEVAVIIEYSDFDGDYTHTEKEVQISLADGSQRIMLEVLTNVINYWEQFCLREGIDDKARKFAYDDKPRFRSRDECEEMGLQITTGVGMKPVMRFLRYNHGTGKYDSFLDAVSRLHFSLTNNGQVYTATVTLLGDDIQKLNGLATSEEKEAFANSLEAVQKAFRHLRRKAGMADDEPFPSAALTDKGPSKQDAPPE